jgi:hypothetical protein
MRTLVFTRLQGMSPTWRLLVLAKVLTFDRVNVGFCRINQVHFVFHPLQEVLLWLPTLNVDLAQISKTNLSFAVLCMTSDDRWLELDVHITLLSMIDASSNEIKAMKTHILILLSLHHILVTYFINN